MPRLTRYDELEPGAIFSDKRITAPAVKIDDEHAVWMGGTIGTQVYLYSVPGNFRGVYQDILADQFAALAFDLLQHGRLSPDSDWALWDEILSVRPELGAGDRDEGGSMKHTPGPWHIENQFNVMGRSPFTHPTVDPMLVAVCDKHIDDHIGGDSMHRLKLANSRLIADAPRMLDALARAEQTIRNLALCGALEGDYKQIAINESFNLSADIAHAKGETE